MNTTTTDRLLHLEEMLNARMNECGSSELTVSQIAEECRGEEFTLEEIAGAMERAALNYSREWRFLPYDETAAESLGIVEIKKPDGEYEVFYLVDSLDGRIRFGGCCNIGFIESGYIECDGFSVDECLCELVEELECYYRDGASYCTHIICNERM